MNSANFHQQRGPASVSGLHSASVLGLHSASVSGLHSASHAVKKRKLVCEENGQGCKENTGLGFKLVVCS